MANILFPTSVIGMMVLPLMIFHQIQLMVCGTGAALQGADGKAGAGRDPRRESLRTFQGLNQLGQPL